MDKINGYRPINYGSGNGNIKQPGGQTGNNNVPPDIQKFLQDMKKVKGSQGA